VGAVCGTIRRWGLGGLLAPRASRARQCVLAMIATRVLEPGSKFAAARFWFVATRRAAVRNSLRS